MRGRNKGHHFISYSYPQHLHTSIWNSHWANEWKNKWADEWINSKYEEKDTHRGRSQDQSDSYQLEDIIRSIRHDLQPCHPAWGSACPKRQEPGPLSVLPESNLKSSPLTQSWTFLAQDSVWDSREPYPCPQTHLESSATPSPPYLTALKITCLIVLGSPYLLHSVIGPWSVPSTSTIYPPFGPTAIWSPPHQATSRPVSLSSLLAAKVSTFQIIISA